MLLLFAIFGMVVGYSLLTILWLWVFKRFGYDVLAHLRITQQSGKKTKFYFEAFGVVAFVVAQPIVLTATTVMAFQQTRPLMDQATDMLKRLLIA